MFHCNMRPLMLMVGGLTIISCTDETTAPEASTNDLAVETSPATAAASLAIAGNSWTSRADMPSTERWGVATATVRNASGQSILYVIGGTTSTGGTLSKVQAYNAATNTWSYKASLPIPLVYTNGAAVINGKIYISGGVASHKNYRKETFMYDPATNRWTRKQDMPYSTWGGVTGVINNQLYVATCTGEEDCTSEVPLGLYRYDPASDHWTELSVSPPRLGRPMGGTIGGKLYVTGGGGASFRDESQLVVYDPATNTWSSRKSMPRPRFFGAYTTLGAKLYVIGGYERISDGNTQLVRTTSVYDPATNSWTTRAPLPRADRDLGANRVVVNGQTRIEVVGGRRPDNNLQYTP